MADKSNDPLAMWKNMIGEMEKGFVSFANEAMASPALNKVMNPTSGATAGSQEHLGVLIEKYLVTMNLPSRAQVVSMDDRLQSIEGQLSEIKALLHQLRKEGGSAAAPKAPRRNRSPAPNELPK